MAKTLGDGNNYNWLVEGPLPNGQNPTKVAARCVCVSPSLYLNLATRSRAKNKKEEEKVTPFIFLRPSPASLHTYIHPLCPPNVPNNDPIIIIVLVAIFIITIVQNQQDNRHHYRQQHHDRRRHNLMVSIGRQASPHPYYMITGAATEEGALGKIFCPGARIAKGSYRAFRSTKRLHWAPKWRAQSDSVW